MINICILNMILILSSQKEELQEESGLETSSNCLKPHIDIFIHFGVNAGSSKIHLETQAVNDADFGIPDVKGNQPWQQQIEPSKSIQFRRRTDFNLRQLLERVDPDRLSSDLSDSAGTYICNYIYYTSLWKAGREGIRSLFVHIPNFDQVPREMQVFVVDKYIKEMARDLTFEVLIKSVQKKETIQI